MYQSFIKFIVILAISKNAFGANKNVTCLDMVPSIEENFNNITAVPGGIEGQIQIDKEASGLSRFTRVDQVLLMDAERVPLLSEKRKEIYPTLDLSGRVFEGFHVAVKTHKTYHNGVEIFNTSLSDEAGGVSELFGLGRGFYYFKNYVLSAVPFERDPTEGSLWLLSHGEDRIQKWSQHSFLFPALGVLKKDTRLNLFFETDFDNTNGGEGSFILNWLENSASGPRVDTCVFFLVRSLKGE